MRQLTQLEFLEITGKTGHENHLIWIKGFNETKPIRERVKYTIRYGAMGNEIGIVVYRDALPRALEMKLQKAEDGGTVFIGGGMYGRRCLA